MIVARMGKAPRAGASNGTKVPDAVPVANPCGRADTLFMYVKYASALSKDGSTGGVSPIFAVVDDAIEEEEDDSAAAPNDVVMVEGRCMDDPSTANAAVVHVVVVVVRVVTTTITNMTTVRTKGRIML